ncbi:hypothetical protein RB594_000695 [Gaeumannomyces avenae]
MGNPSAVDAITTPARAFELRGSKYDWSYKTGMIDRPEYTRIEKPNTRGKVLGGSSCLNYYTWIPGSAATYDDWVPYGGAEWGWDAFKQYLYKPATYHDDKGLYSEKLRYMGAGGPLPVSHSDLIPEAKPFRDAFERAWVSKGEPLTDDVHGGTMRGLWLFLEGKRNVTVLGHTHAKRRVIEGGRAVGVEAIGPDGEATLSFRVAREVIVSLGVYESPKLLMLSSVGPRAELGRFGIGVAVESAHVGQNLLDHPILPHVFKTRNGCGLDWHLLRALEKDAAVSAYRWKNKGSYTSGLLELVGLPRIDERLAACPEYAVYKAANGGVDPFGPGRQPHFEIDFVPMFSDTFQWHIPCPPAGDHLTVIVDLLRPLSKSGTVTLNSADPLEQAKIDINFFSHDLDLVAMREGVRWVDDVLMNGEGMRDMIEGDYPWPMTRHSDEAMETMVKERSQTGFRWSKASTRAWSTPTSRCLESIGFG